MSKVKQLFEIDNYDLQEDKIVVDIDRQGKEEEIIIPREDFEQWLSDSGRLDWCDDRASNRPDSYGEHLQTTGTWTLETYWFDSSIEKKSDLYDWIILKKVSEGAFDIKQPLANILGGHFFTALNAAL